jgi:hypothetical protein
VQTAARLPPKGQPPPSFFLGRLLLLSIRAREREHTTCATVSGPRHRSNTTLSISRLLANRPPAQATIKGPSSAWSIWREGEGGEGEGEGGRGEGRESAAYVPVYVIPSCSMRCQTESVRSECLDVSILLCVCRVFFITDHCIGLSRLAFTYFLSLSLARSSGLFMTQ